jgi:DNA-binding transcriptional LysR family regulator
MDTRVTLRRVEVFCLVVEEGSVTRAAEHLFVAQPAVSSQLRTLEEWVGAKLFVRSGSRLVLTDAGRRVYDWGKELLAQSLEMQRDVAGLGEGTRGALVVASSMAIGTYVLPPIMIALQAQRPETEIVITVAQPQAALHAAEIGEADVAFVAWDGRDPPDHFVGEHLHSERIVLCASPSTLPGIDRLEPSDVPDLPHVDTPRSGTFHRMLELQLRQQGIGERNILIRLGHAEAMKRAVLANEMVGFLPLYVVEDDVRAGELRIIDVPGVSLHEELWMFTRRAKAKSPLHEAAVEAVKEHLATRPH